jgi:hypothetical protein
MIREKTIFFKLNSSAPSDRQLLGSFTPRKKNCPACRAHGRLVPHGSYRRAMVSINDGRVCLEQIRVKRVICKSCNKTHALLADILIPHGAYTLRFIIHVIRAYINRSGTVEGLCAHYQIAVSTLYCWKKCFREHTNLLLTAFGQISQMADGIIDFISDIEALPESFFNKFGFSFLQNQKLQRTGGAPG